MAQQDAFLHIQQHRGATGGFVLCCKDRKREKRISFACNFPSSTETLIGWDGKMPYP